MIYNQPMNTRISHFQRNHGLEHASVHLLSKSYPIRGGFSIESGFFLVGDVPTEAIAGASTEALARLQQGETSLAFHPYCGTNAVVAGTLAGLLAGLTVMFSQRSRGDRFSGLILGMGLATWGVFFGLPLGNRLQRYTVSGDMDGLAIEMITRHELGSLVLHYISTRLEG
jgi:hypothetical protein